MAENYPIRTTMNDCAEAWNIQREPVSPFFAAAQFFAELERRRQRYDTYLQTIITGGGHTHDPKLERVQAVERNTRNGLAVADMLYDEHVVDPSGSAEAAAMPVINGWLQDDWMTFWPLIISKPEFTSMSANRIMYLEEQFKQKIWERANFHGLDMAAYRDRTIDKSVRLRHYTDHANALHEALSINKVPLKPVHRIVGLLGIEESVGSTAEKDYATNLGVRAYRVAMASVQPLSPEQLSNAELGSNIRRLHELGVHALSGAPTQQLILVEDRTPTNWDIRDAMQQRLL